MCSWFTDRRFIINSDKLDKRDDCLQKYRSLEFWVGLPLYLDAIFAVTRGTSDALAHNLQNEAQLKAWASEFEAKTDVALIGCVGAIDGLSSCLATQERYNTINTE